METPITALPGIGEKKAAPIEGDKVTGEYDDTIPEISISDAAALQEEGVISGGMIPKVECCVEAINKGVKKVFIMDGRVPHSILMEILTNEGAGTMVRGDR